MPVDGGEPREYRDELLRFNEHYHECFFRVQIDAHRNMNIAMEDLKRWYKHNLLDVERNAILNRERGKIGMSMKEVQELFVVLEQRERLIAKLAVIAGMRPGEIFGLT